ncbi:uncharacterized protein Z518_06911 [Rhinocladiella mackenziei CBS 650.93]|uniref:Uncharacterized protein n=1 Tax=Rhinocladiella mackenziei CBS 650.93 TaxID=1442369 RepID=A0A0D2IC19_9EURO|nr:uncharacterized protein Z518_06911 [Rhinocladiella mackenziei CBS 650.93]KIX03359.1 hypothetical protein Z518_06911 [Rhinocladiella mackenziei CBS 650.93]
MAPRFLFVNKDARSTSLTRSNASEQSSINSHVQRGRPHRRSAPASARSGNRTRRTFVREKSNTSSASSQAGFSTIKADPSASAPPAKDGLVHGPDISQRRLPSRPHSRNERSHRNESDKPPSPINRSPAASSTDGKSIVLLNPSHPLNSPRDVSQMTDRSLDPFGISVVKLDPHVAKLCRYFCENFHPSVWNAETWASPEGSYTYQTSAPVVIRRAMQSEVEMNAMLACMAARMENVDRIPGQGTDKYMGNALKAVRRQFSSAPKHQLLLTIFHLFAGEAYRQNYQAAKIHMRAAKVLFDSWGGLNHVPDPCLRELFIIGDGHMSAALLEPCDLPCEWDPGPYWDVTPSTLQLAPEQDLSNIAPALQKNSNDGFLSDDLVNAIRETAECTWVLHYAPLGSPEATKHAARWLQWRNAAVRYRLLAMKCTDLSLDAVRVGLLMWILTSMVLLGIRRLGNLIAPKLQNILRKANNPSYQWQGRVELKIWILTVGAMCSMINSEEENWFVDQLFEIGLPTNIQRFRDMHPENETVDILKNFQEKFFYYDAIQRPRLERLAYLIQDGQSQRSSSVSQGTPSDPGWKTNSPS